MSIWIVRQQNIAGHVTFFFVAAQLLDCLEGEKKKIVTYSNGILFILIL